MDREGRFLGFAAEVTGSAKRRIRSDLVDWSAMVSVGAPDVRSGYQTLKADTDKVTAFLERRGVPRAQIVVSQVSTRAITKPVFSNEKEPKQIDQRIVGYEVRRSVSVHGNDCDKLAQIARDVTDLVGEGVNVESSDPRFHYSKLGELKIQMAAEAAKDCFARAKVITEANGGHVGKLRSSRLGVIQINPANSTDTSGEGNNDTTSIDKDIITVVSSTFTLD